jgi:PAS domain S-box-containing protein
VPIWVKDRAGRYVVASRAYAGLVGLAPDALPGRTDAELLHRSTARMFKEHDQAALRAGLPCQQEEPLVVGEERRTLETLRVPLYDVDGLPTAICGVSTDTSAARRARLRQAQLAAIVTSTDEAMVGETLEGVVTAWNPAAERIYGYSEQEMIGRPIFELVPPDEQARLHAVMARVAAGETIARERERRIHKQGHQFWVSLTLAPMRDAEGQVMGINAISRDVSRLQEAEELARRLQADLATAHELDRAKRAFFGAISHDLRSPITSVIGWAELLLDTSGDTLTDQQHKALETLLAAANQQRTLLEDLLDLARADAGSFDIRPEPADLGATARMTVDLLAPEAARAGITLEAETPVRGPELAFDRDRMGQVLRNLVGNALKFTPEGGRVELRVRPDGDAVRCEVRDTGPGIDPADHRRIFEPFSQLAAGRRARGAGLGLAIAKAIVEAHGGEIGVESQPGQGSTFWIRLPAAALAPRKA